MTAAGLLRGHVEFQKAERRRLLHAVAQLVRSIRELHDANLELDQEDPDFTQAIQENRQILQQMREKVMHILLLFLGARLSAQQSGLFPYCRGRCLLRCSS